MVSYEDLFFTAAYQTLLQESLSTLAFQQLPEAMGKQTRHSIALAMSLAKELLIFRRDAVLASFSVLLNPSRTFVQRL